MSHNPRGWCSNRECPCWRPSKRACSEWMGYAKTWRGVYQGPYKKNDIESWPFKYCPRCGWEKKDHKAVIHNGKKPR